MNGRYLLDTTIVIALFANEQNVQHQLGEASEVLAATSNVIGCDLETARQYGTIKNQLRLKGRPIPENDIWIAAQSIQNQLTLVARDSHFDEIEAISIASW